MLVARIGLHFPLFYSILNWGFISYFLFMYWVNITFLGGNILIYGYLEGWTYIVYVFVNIKFLKIYLFIQNQPTKPTKKPKRFYSQSSLEANVGVSLRSHQLIVIIHIMGAFQNLMRFTFAPAGFFGNKHSSRCCDSGVKMWLLDLCSSSFCLNDIQSFPSSLHSCKTAQVFRGKGSGIGYLMGKEFFPHSVRTQKVRNMAEALANLTGFFRLWKEGRMAVLGELMCPERH